MKTKQGSFEQKYNHIEAPTFSDDKKKKLTGKRKLVLPFENVDRKKVWRESELEYLANNEWYYKRKLDGENMRVLWDGERTLWNGKINDFICKDDTVEMMSSTFLEEIFEEKFGRDKEVLLFGERMGPRCQGNELDLDKTTFVMFDVKIGETWLEPKNIVAIAKYFDVPTCYDFMEGAERVIDGDGYRDTLVNLIERTNMGDFKDWEGVVAMPVAGLYNRKGERLIVKIKNKDYLEEV